MSKVPKTWKIPFVRIWEWVNTPLIGEAPRTLGEKRRYAKRRDSIVAWVFTITIMVLWAAFVLIYTLGGVPFPIPGIRL